MCLAVPMLVLDVTDDTAIAEIDGVRREASLLMLGERWQSVITLLSMPVSPSPALILRRRRRPCA